MYPILLHLPPNQGEGITSKKKRKFGIQQLAIDTDLTYLDINDATM